MTSLWCRYLHMLDPTESRVTLVFLFAGNLLLWAGIYYHNIILSLISFPVSAVVISRSFKILARRRVKGQP
jgi:hypothetical protein